MKLKRALEKISSRFTYKEDTFKSDYFDSWRVMDDSLDRLYGDCDDYAMTVLYEYYKTPWDFFLNVIVLRKAKLYQAETMNGTKHIVASIGNKYFDNWTLDKYYTKKKFLKHTKHKILREYYGPEILLYLIIGFFKG